MRLGADSGGTFTDVVGSDGRLLKIPSTPADPSEAVRRGVAAAAGGHAEVLAHGTTVATNALLERALAPVTLVSTVGLEDVIEIARQDRPSLYDPWARRPAPLVPRGRRVGCGGRLGPDGAELEELSDAEIDRVVDEVRRTTSSEGVAAVCLLHADLDGRHEQRLAAALAAAGVPVTVSHRVAAEFREYERTVTTVVDSGLTPVCAGYLGALEGVADTVEVMTSAGGLVDLASAAASPATLLLSGPAGGVRAAAAVAAACGHPDAVSFDMGGTSTDVALIRDGEPAPAGLRDVDGLPIRLPSLDVHTIGSGGGSIAWIDAGGALRVGPRSAGAVPGPACYGRGGERPTVTDADLVLGRIPADAAFPGLGRLDVAAAEAALERVGVAATDVVEVVDAQMEQAVRAVSVERGIDPEGVALVAFGGAGPLHAAALAEGVGIPVVVVPAAAGVLSAVGLLTSPVQRELVRSWPTPGDLDGLEAAAAELAARAHDMVAADRGAQDAPVRVATAFDCRYRGQSHELRVPSVDAFAAAHRERNGYVLEDASVEVVALRAVATSSAPASIEDVLARAGVDGAGREAEAVAGPRVLARPDCTVWVPPGWTARPGALGSLVMERSA